MKIIEFIGWLFLVMFLTATSALQPLNAVDADDLLGSEENCAAPVDEKDSGCVTLEETEEIILRKCLIDYRKTGEGF